MLKNRKFSRLLSMIVVFVLLLASIPAKEVKAAESGQDIFVITSFDKMDGQEKWKHEKTTFVPGTEIKDMEFPSEWKVNGYLQSDSTKTPVEKKLEKLEWKGFQLQKEDDETEKILEDVPYTKESPEGNYLFVMQLPEGMVMQEETEAPSQKILIQEEGKTEEASKTDNQPPTAPAADPPVPASTNAEITSFKIGEWEGKIGSDKKIEVTVPYGTDVKSLTPKIEISEKATCSPAPEKAADFTNPVTYTVTAEDGTTAAYIVTVIIADCGHNWQPATCTEPETCSICKVTRGEAKGHDWKPATCTTPETCSVCQVTQGEAKGHDWKPATCTEPETCSICKVTQGEAKGHDWKPATCTEPETCSVCKATRGEAKGHQWKEATCTEPKTCTVCGTKEGEPLNHDWKPATCTEPETCVRCALTRGAPLEHNWGEWKVTKQPTIKEGGTEERICSRCQVKETRETPRLNIIGNPKNNFISGIKEKGIYGINERITIAAYGDGMKNDVPIANDVRYVPAGWEITSYSSWEKAPYKTTFRISKEGDYQLEVHFQKQIYDGKNWINQKETDIKYVNFTISANKVVPAKTSDEAPVGMLITLMTLTALSLVVAVIYYKRKKV
ncbi:MAG: DUF5018 domain-containing protein [Clostridiales bacterium]|nr:DUF5018 domain-containing protein [Clostridiales bacterium]